MNNSEFKNLMACIPTCVAVIWGTTNSRSVFGCTISSLVSISIQPGNEEVLFVLKKLSHTGAKLRECQTFKISVLEENQSHIAKKFSEGFPGNENSNVNHFDDWSNDVVSEFTLELIGEYEREASILFVAKVIKIFHTQNAKPLVYLDRNYVRIKR